MDLSKKLNITDIASEVSSPLLEHVELVVYKERMCVVQLALMNDRCSCLLIDCETSN